MTGSRAAFQDLNTMVNGIVRFRDDSEARIKGRGTMVVFYKGSERRSFVGCITYPG
jgi:hypothetical protein